jgi:hypothetical protein
MARYTVYANIENKDSSYESSHRTLKGAGLAWQARHTGNLRRVIDETTGKDVTHLALDAAHRWEEARR